MFDDSQTTQGAQENNNNTPAENVITPTLGLGVNPTNPTVIAPTDNSQPQTSAPAAPEEDEQLQQPTEHNTPAPSAPVSDDLHDIKRQALEQLSPLVHQLEQTPEEKYKTIMMMIQASDNQALVSEAYAAAQSITDEKAKAEALLNIVNEINYFTQKAQ